MHPGPIIQELSRVPGFRAQTPEEVIADRGTTPPPTFWGQPAAATAAAPGSPAWGDGVGTGRGADAGRSGSAARRSMPDVDGGVPTGTLRPRPASLTWSASSIPSSGTEIVLYFQDASPLARDPNAPTPPVYDTAIPLNRAATVSPYPGAPVPPPPTFCPSSSSPQVVDQDPPAASSCSPLIPPPAPTFTSHDEGGGGATATMDCATGTGDLFDCGASDGGGGGVAMVTVDERDDGRRAPSSGNPRLL